MALPPLQQQAAALQQQAQAAALWGAGPAIHPRPPAAPADALAAAGLPALPDAGVLEGLSSVFGGSFFGQVCVCCRGDGGAGLGAGPLARGGRGSAL